MHIETNIRDYGTHPGRVTVFKPITDVRATTRWPSLLRRLVTWCVRESRLRRDAARLNEMSDYLLRDVGLNRSDIDDAVRLGHPNRRTSRADWY